MKRYRLLKDFFGKAKGTLFIQEEEVGSYFISELPRTYEDLVFYERTMISNPEWFVKVKEEKEEVKPIKYLVIKDCFGFKVGDVVKTINYHFDKAASLPEYFHPIMICPNDQSFNGKEFEGIECPDMKARPIYVGKHKVFYEHTTGDECEMLISEFNIFYRLARAIEVN